MCDTDRYGVAAMSDSPTCLLTVTGKDRSGLTAALFRALEDLDCDVLDVEQVVIRGRLLLGILISAPGDADLARVRHAAQALGLSVEAEATVGDARHRAPGRSHVTIIGLPLRPSALAALSAAIADLGGNIDRIHRIARYPVTAVELAISGASPDVLRTALAQEAVRHGVDVAVQPSGLQRRSKRLVVMDVDSTLVQGEVVEMLAAMAGHEAEVAAITERAMRGELDFEQSLRARVAMLEGLPASSLAQVHADLSLMPGARTLIRTLQRLGYRTGIVSGGFTAVTDPLAADLGIDHARANELEIVDGRLTGQLVGPVVDRAAKAAFLREVADLEGVPIESTVAIGDGANDLDMIETAGLGVAFNAKPVLRDAADTSLSTPYLDAILYLLGITREEIEHADAESGSPTPAPPVIR
jgi:phosphoserine phosphatase